MTTEPSSSGTDPEPADATAAAAQSPAAPDHHPRVTRVSAIWVATGAALVLLVLLIVFILQNSTKVEVHFLGLSGTIPLGMALLIAAVSGGVVVAVAGIARVTQLRVNARRTRRSAARD